MSKREPPIGTADLDFVLDQTNSLWTEMRGQHLFITGGTGFFGAWLLSSFLHINQTLALKARATVLTRDPASFAARLPHLANDPAITLLQGDVRTFDPPPGTYSYIIHAATEVATPAPAFSPLERYSTIADGTAHVLEFAAAHGTQKLLLTSSGAVYGQQPPNLTHVPEDYLGAPNVLAPASAYGEGKRVSELMCSLYALHTGIECKIARCFAFAGPCLALDSNFAIGNFIRDVMRGGPIRIAGDGTAIRSYLYAADLTVWLWTLLFRGVPMQAYNVGSEEAISIRDLALMVAETLDPQIKVEVAKSATPGATPLSYVPATTRARETLSLRQTVTLRESIRRTAAWHGFPAT